MKQEYNTEIKIKKLWAILRDINHELDFQENFEMPLEIMVDDYTQTEATLRFKYGYAYVFGDRGKSKQMSITALIDTWIENDGKAIVDALVGCVEGWGL